MREISKEVNKAVFKGLFGKSYKKLAKEGALFGTTATIRFLFENVDTHVPVAIGLPVPLAPITCTVEEFRVLQLMMTEECGGIMGARLRPIDGERFLELVKAQQDEWLAGALSNMPKEEMGEA